MTELASHYTAVIIGSGFGGSMTGLTLARAFKERGLSETLLMLERGTWWTTPVTTVQDKEVKTYDFLVAHKQPVQFWSSLDHFKGIVDLLLRCVRRKKNEDGLYDFTTFERRGFLRLFGGESDGVSILRASGVGGGSLVYSNVTIRPPDFIFADSRWPLTWSDAERHKYFDLARHAIGYGVISAWESLKLGKIPYTDLALPPQSVNTGLSNIVTRSAWLDPFWKVKTDLNNSRGIKQLDPSKLTVATPTNPTALNPYYAFWIDRARVFQAGMSQLTNDYGTVDSSINNINLEPNPLDPDAGPKSVLKLDNSRVGKNYCERQGRCNIGCLPGARHTLNKQLMTAIYGTPQGTPPLYPEMHLEALAEVSVVEANPGGGYTVHFVTRNPAQPWRTTAKKVTADRVIVAGGCVGTNEIMLRSKARGTLPHLSERVGFGFSTNGDYLAFLTNTNEHISLTRGPVTTSFAHFNTPEAGPNADQSKFHTIEDQGFPRTLASLIGVGLPMLRSLVRGHGHVARLLILWAIVHWFFTRFLPHYVSAFFRESSKRQDIFQSEDEYTAKMMCIAGMGREAAVGQFRLGDENKNETPLRVQRTDGKAFKEDPIYHEIRATLKHFAAKLTSHPTKTFINPFLQKLDATGLVAPIALSHPLGGCRMAHSAAEGVVDEYGRVFDITKTGDHPFYTGFYLADAAVIPTALGVNPSLTISALSLRIAQKIVEELPIAGQPPESIVAKPNGR